MLCKHRPLLDKFVSCTVRGASFSIKKPSKPCQNFCFSPDGNICRRVNTSAYSVEKSTRPRIWSDRISSWPVKPVFTSDIIDTDSTDVSGRCSGWLRCPAGKKNPNSPPSSSANTQGYVQGV